MNYKIWKTILDGTGKTRLIELQKYGTRPRPCLTPLLLVLEEIRQHRAQTRAYCAFP